MRIAILVLTVSALVSTFAQDATVSPSPAARHVTLRFALPPLKGTISLGIYDRVGKLVRVLHREDELSEFTAGHDALETIWDGNDDAGRPLPNGKYSARGYVVGDLKIEGVDYFFNDFVTDEKSSHIRSLGQFARGADALQVGIELAGGEKKTLVCDPATGALKGLLPPNEQAAHCEGAGPTPNIISPRDCALGKDGTKWFIDALDEKGAREVKQLSPQNELLRRLSYTAMDPQPASIEASPNEEKIFLVESNEQLQRLRALALATTMKDGGESVSDWKTLFERKIVAHQKFEIEKGKPIVLRTTLGNSLTKVVQNLLPNPLQHDKPGRVDLTVGFDADGSYLQAADGLPLRTISDTKNLIRALLGRPNDEAIDIFQDDGAVVEQFRISKLAQMIAFDCGDFELK